MKKILSLLVVISAVFLSGCAYKEININLANAQKLRRGMTKDQVLQVMGEPLKNQRHADENNWYYRNQVRCFDGQCTADECTVLVFENDVLIGWGAEFNAKRAFATPKSVEQ